MGKSLTLPELYKIDSKGKLRVWVQYVFEKENMTELVTKSGIQGGSLTNRKKEVTDSKRELAWDRALKLANNNIEKKLRIGYHRTPEEAKNADVLLRPEEAETFDPESMTLVPGKIFVQPKINGLKCIYNPEADELMTKTGLQYHIPWIKSSLKELSDDLNKLPVDVELYIPGLSVGQILSAAKTLDHPERHRFEAHVVTYVSDEPFQLRDSTLKSAFRVKSYDHLILTKTLRISDLDYMPVLQRHYDQFLYEKWEGLMIRNGDAPYHIGKRTYDLMKWKPTITQEFPVWHITYENRYVEAMGSMAKLVEFHCRTKEGLSFKVVPKWDVKRRFQFYLDNVGKTVEEIVESLPPLQVEFREWTPDKKPFHGVGLYFRDHGY